MLRAKCRIPAADDMAHSARQSSSEPSEQCCTPSHNWLAVTHSLPTAHSYSPALHLPDKPHNSNMSTLWSIEMSPFYFSQGSVEILYSWAEVENVVLLSGKFTQEIMQKILYDLSKLYRFDKNVLAYLYWDTDTQYWNSQKTQLSRFTR